MMNMMPGGTRTRGKKPRKFETPIGGKSEKRGSPYIVDKALTPRVKQYLSQFRKGYTPDVDEMTGHLQSRYGEYNRKKRNTFKLSVQKVYQAICKEKSEETFLQNLEDKFLNKKKKSPSYMQLQEDGDDANVKQDQSTHDIDGSDSEFSLDDEPLVEAQDTNMMNQSMQMMYKVSTSRPTSGAEDNDETTTVPSDVAQDVDHLPEGASVQASQMPTSLSTGGSTIVSQSQNPSTDDTRHEEETPFVPANLIVTKSQESLSNKTQSVSTPKRKLAQAPAATEETDSTTRSSRKRRKRDESKKDDLEKQPGFSSTTSTVKFADIGGCAETIEQVTKLLVHMWHPEVFTALGVTPTTGFLLHGPPGCGKTLLAHAIAGELQLPFLKLAATEIVSGVSGESEEKVRDLFTSATAQAPCVLFLDEIDAITPKRENASKDMERRIVSQLLSCLDDLNSNPEAHVLVIGATNRPDALDPALRRAGRFDREISMGIPDEKARASVLQVMCKLLKLSDGFSFSWLARQTPGYVGADLMALTREAAMIAVNRTFEDLQRDVPQVAVESCSTEPSPSDDRNTIGQLSPSEDKNKSTAESPPAFNVMEWLRTQPPLSADQLATLSITTEDFKAALSVVQPSAKREGFATVPDVTWADVGALQDVREELSMAILAPVRHPDEFSALGLSHPPGILLAGPPGCGKTLLAKAIANESGINFISVKGPELLNMYVGESERAVRQVFQRARNSAPCVIFFDELDSLCPRRSGSSESGSSVRVVNQLLTEMDGVQARKQVFIMGATNRPDIIDPAVMRPGRLDKVLYVGLPNAHDRYDILRTLTKNGTKPQLLSDVNLENLARDKRCVGFSGADLAALVREACMAALRECIGMTSSQTVVPSNSTAGSQSTSVPMATVTATPLQDASENALSEVFETKFSNQGGSVIAERATVGGSASRTVGVGLRHFERAFDKVRPSVSDKDQIMYEQIRTYAAKL